MNLETLRARFLSYFEQHGHGVVPSAALVPHNDPTLMFTNAGMVPFKHIFTGKEAPPSPPRATSSQKCVRAGGKHNDLDNVGYTARHHTFFEMMGNFSFGDYFKRDAIHYAWTFLTQELRIPAEKLYVTVYHTDDEAYNLWKEISGLAEEKILRIPTSDNFWSMGDTGPCGPCSEIFYDHGVDAAEGTWVLDNDGQDLFGDRYIEIWNLVFMQYEQLGDGTRVPLPSPCVDTGMGLERMAALMQGVHDNYETDLFQNIIIAIERITKKARTQDTYASYKVIADHARSCAFLMADGVLPSNEGRGYVLRRIMRRAMRHVHMLGATQPVMHEVAAEIIRLMGNAYPELVRAEALIQTTLRQEETRFRETLERGLSLLEEALEELPDDAVLAGEIAFKLYDTYGFPLDLTQDIVRSRGIIVDIDGFDACMAEQKQRARAAWKGSGATGTDDVWLALHDMHGNTEFTGHTQTQTTAIITSIVIDGKEVQEATAGMEAHILCNQTPFYAESGGQVGDTGNILVDGADIASVTDTKAPVAGMHVHHITLHEGALRVGDNVTLSIDDARRQAIRANHSATHLLHAALRKLLGDHVTQKGSLVTPDRLRFDFSHTQSVTPDELQRVEHIVNRLIWNNTPVTTQLMSADDAIEAGAMALFGEKYDAQVRVLTIGLEDNTHYSMELCGGTHVAQSGDIALFHIVSESAIASGVRRIEAVTREQAYEHFYRAEHALKMCATSLTSTMDDVPARLDQLMQERKTLQKQLLEAKKQLALGSESSAASEEQIGDITFVSRHVHDLPAKELRPLALSALKDGTRTIAAIASTVDGKGAIIVGLTPDLLDAHHAADYVKAAVSAMGGKGGGGRPELAQGGGANGEEAPQALRAIAALMAQNIKKI